MQTTERCSVEWPQSLPVLVCQKETKTKWNIRLDSGSSQDRLDYTQNWLHPFWWLITDNIDSVSAVSNNDIVEYV